MTENSPKRRRSSWFAFYPDDYAGGTRGMSLAAKGAFVDLLAYQFANGSIPNDDRTICRIVGAFPDEWEQISAEVLSKFEQQDSGILINQRMQKERDEREEIRSKRVDASRIGNQKRWQKDQDGNPKTVPNGITNGIDLGLATTTTTTALSSSKNKNTPLPPNGESRQAAQVLPDSFSEASKQAISEWETFRREIKKPLTASTRQKVIEAMTADPAGTIASINRSITNGWQGLFPDNDTRAVMRQHQPEPKKSAPKQTTPDGWEAVYATIDPNPVYSDGEYCCPDWDRLAPDERAEVTRKMAAMPSESPQRGLNGSGNQDSGKAD